MDSRVRADERVNGGNLANDACHASVRPSTAVAEGCKDDRGVVLGGHDPERDQDGKKAEHVENKHHALEGGQMACAEGVEEGAE
jgi:hypothetical protein